jgi:hypothetical protein
VAALVPPRPDGHGYWEVGADGGVFCFDDPLLHGSIGASHLNIPVDGIAAISGRTAGCGLQMGARAGLRPWRPDRPKVAFLPLANR